MGSVDLVQMEFAELNFTGKWLYLIGRPSPEFDASIYGKAGQGKSTFSAQFACYLAENFGKVAYISSEEGITRTMKDKLVQNNAYTPNLDIVEVGCFEDIINGVPRGVYRFLFLDSLDDMGITPDKLKQIKVHFGNIAIISISQVTKQGQIRGSNQLGHNTQIQIRVDKGKAITEKNRYEKTPKVYVVFEEGFQKK